MLAVGESHKRICIILDIFFLFIHSYCHTKKECTNYGFNIVEYATIFLENSLENFKTAYISLI